MLKIAICDDEQPIREYLKRLVEKCTEGEIRLFADGGELLADPTAFDLILLDISLNRSRMRRNRTVWRRPERSGKGRMH